MTGMAFYKMSGSGNDFILIDNRNLQVPVSQQPSLARHLCRRKLSVGADGCIFLEEDDEVDFRWRFYNADGSEAEMCGNGGRCAARLAHVLGICPARLSFRTKAGIISAEVLGTRVKLQMSPPHSLALNRRVAVDGKEISLHSVNTGVPHVVLLQPEAESLARADVFNLGRRLRYHPAFAPEGTNVNFVAVDPGGDLRIRTYERGVEDETLACGTGATAAALVGAALGLVHPPVRLHTRGGEILTIHFQPTEPLPPMVYLEGETTLVYRGELQEEALADISRLQEDQEGATPAP